MNFKYSANKILNIKMLKTKLYILILLFPTHFSHSKGEKLFLFNYFQKQKNKTTQIFQLYSYFLYIKIVFTLRTMTYGQNLLINLKNIIIMVKN